MNREEFDKWLEYAWSQKDPGSEPSPFCPFEFFGYCDQAFSEKCYECEDGPNARKE